MADTPASARAALAGRPALTLPERRDLLAALAAAVLARADAIVAALAADYGARAAEDTLLAEVQVVADSARHARRHLGRWARPRRVGVPIPFLPTTAWVECVPKGVVGIMAPWNYPVLLLLSPAIDAIAAGNRVALKPSEATPRTAELLAGLAAAALGPEVARTVLGGPEVAAAFAAQPWDHLVFTGGTATGRKVMAAAAANLTPLTLELGGKCPAVVLPGARLAPAARAILAGKWVNAGQTCIAPDTVLLVGHARAAFLDACRAADPGPLETSVLQPGRLAALAEGAQVTPIGGPDGLALIEAPAGHAVHTTEIFGPLLGLVAVPDLDAARDWLAAQPPPLALYLFGADRGQAAAIAAATRSGAIVEGRCVEHAAFPDLPFGGVGASGFGRRNGEAGFREFSTLRARVRDGGWGLARLVDPPRSARARALVRRILR